MKNLFQTAQEYIRRMSVWDVAALKFCLFCLGMICGSFLDERNRRWVRWVCFPVFAATYVYLLTDFMLHCVRSWRALRHSAHDENGYWE